MGAGWDDDRPAVDAGLMGDYFPGGLGHVRGAGGQDTFEQWLL